MKNSSLPYRCVCQRAPAIIALVALAGCIQPIPKQPGQQSFVSIDNHRSHLLTKAKSADEVAATLTKYVTIDGTDILLPEASPDQIELQQSYFFDVVASDPEGRSMRELLEQKILRIETVGVDATLVYPVAKTTEEIAYEVLAKKNGQPSPPTINANKARLKVMTSKDGALRPFTIRAWYQGREGDPQWEKYSADLRVRVYYGDIRTRVQIIGRTEAEGLFGSTFAKHFFVGKVFLRNRSTTKSLAVYTTSMRVPVLFYRKSELPGGLTALAADQLDAMAEQSWRRGDAKSPEFIAEAYKVVEGFEQRWPYGSYMEGDRLDHSRGRLPERRGKGATPKSSPAAHSGASLEEKNALVSRVLAEWARLSKEVDAEKEDAKKLTREEQALLIDAAMKGKIPEDAERSGKSSTLSKSILAARPEALVTDRGQNLVARVWFLRKELELSAERRKAAARLRIERLVNELPADATEQAKLYAEIKKDLTAVRATIEGDKVKAYGAQEAPPSEPTPTLLAKIDGVTNNADRETFRWAAYALPNEVGLYATAAALHAYLTDLAEKPTPLRLEKESVRMEIADLKERALWQRNDRPSEKDRRPMIDLGGGKSLAISPDPHLQRQLIEGGYLWRDAYRPMTFQEVLSAVMFTHASDPKTVTVKVLEAIATVAGGAVGLSGTPSTGALKATNFFSTIFVPTLRATLVEDLKKYITNLGDMGMDTVVIIPPNDSVDRFVFFPRGPIYNFPDEYDSVTPGYIRGIEGEELFVEAVPIASDQVVRGGAVDANTLVTRALNEGERSEISRLVGVAQTQARLRTVELASLAARINALMEAAAQGGEKLTDAAAKEAVLQRARDTARTMVASFTAYFGPDQSGVLAATLAKYAITAQDVPPVALPASTLKLPAGTTSVPWRLPVSDVDTPLKSLIFAKAGDEAAAPWLESVEFITADPLQARAVFTIKKTDQKEPRREELNLTVTDAGKNTVGFVQPIEVQPLAFQSPVFTKRDAGPVSLVPTGGAYTVDIGKGSGTLSISLPVFDANPALLKIARADDASTYIESSKHGSAGPLQLTLQLDTSAAPADATNPVAFSVYLVPADTKTTAEDLKAAALAEIALKLDLNPK